MFFFIANHRDGHEDCRHGAYASERACKAAARTFCDDERSVVQVYETRGGTADADIVRELGAYHYEGSPRWYRLNPDRSAR